MVKRYVLTPTSYKYLEIGISVQSIPLVEIVLGDNHGNQLLLHLPTWKTLMEKRTDIEKHAQLIESAPLWIDELMVEFCIMYNSRIVKMSLHNKSLYFKLETMKFLFNLERCIDHMYSQLSENTQLVHMKFSNFVTVLQRHDVAGKTLDSCHIAKTICDSEYFDGESLIDCELLACAMNDIVDAARSKC